MFTRTTVMLIALTTLIIGAVVGADLLAQTSAAMQAPSVIVTATTTIAGVQLGDVRRLQNPSGGTVALARTADDLSEAVKALSASDSVGLAQLSRSGRLQQATSGTQVRVVDLSARYAIPISQVRVLDGPHAGEAWWVLDNSLTQ